MDMLRSISKQSRESVESVLKKKRRAERLVQKFMLQPHYLDAISDADH